VHLFVVGRSDRGQTLAVVAHADVLEIFVGQLRRVPPLGHEPFDLVGGGLDIFFAVDIGQLGVDDVALFFGQPASCGVLVERAFASEAVIDLAGDTGCPLSTDGGACWLSVRAHWRILPSSTDTDPSKSIPSPERVRSAKCSLADLARRSAPMDASEVALARSR